MLHCLVFGINKGAIRKAIKEWPTKLISCCCRKKEKKSEEEETSKEEENPNLNEVFNEVNEEPKIEEKQSVV